MVLLGREKWIEIIFGTLLFGTLSSFVHPSDPFFLEDDFPWIWIVPIMIALRYGVIGGIVSSLILIAIWFVTAPIVSFNDFPKSYFIGGIIVTMICGEYSEAWQSRFRRLEQNNFYAVEKLEQLTHHHYILKLSHDRLEQMILTKPGTLRDALLKLNELIGYESKSSNHSKELLAAQEFLKILAFYCQMTKMAIFPIAGSGRPDQQAIAQIGNGVILDLSDPLVVFALEEAKLSHVNLREIESDLSSKYLIATVMQNRKEEAYGLLVVESMPFFALHKDTLQMVTVLIDYYMDSLDIMPKIEPLIEVFPDIPLDFAKDCVKLSRMERKSYIPSHIVALVFTHETHDMFLQIKRMQRKMDIGWEKKFGDTTALITLMPITDDQGVKGYASRISDWLKTHYGETLEESPILLHDISFSEEADEITTIAVLLQRCAYG